MTIACNENRLLPRPIRHPTKPPIRILMRHLVRLDYVKALLQVHPRAERLVAGTREDGTAQLWLSIVPPPEGAELDGGFDGEAVAVLGSVDCDLEDVFPGEGDEAVLDVGIWVLDPGGDGVFCSWC